MRYLVTGKLIERVLHGESTREQYLHQLRNLIIPTLHVLLEHQQKGRVMGGGVIPLNTLVFIVDLPEQSMSHLRSLMWALPAFDLFDWDVKPMESFEELVTMFDPGK
ncbi:MAG: hypothetical protein AB7K24_29700 [Gemmataceae bacterium]